MDEQYHTVHRITSLQGAELDGELFGAWRNLDFLPMHIGDSWQYEREYTHIGEDSLTFTDYPVVTIIGDTVMENDLGYKVFTIETFLGVDTVYQRLDSIRQQVMAFQPHGAYENSEFDLYWFPGDSSDDYGWEGSDRSWYANFQGEDTLSFSYLGWNADNPTFVRGMGVVEHLIVRDDWPFHVNTGA